MHGASTHTGRLFVGTLRSNYTVPRSGGAQLARRVDDALRETLPSTLSHVLDRVIDVDNDEVWVIRRLEFDADVNSSWGRERVADRLARSFTRSLVHALNHPEDSGVLRFRSRTDFVATFLQDVANGSAWSKWYYRSFEGLRSLQASGIIRTVLCDDPGQGARALLSMDESSRSYVLRAMMDEDLQAFAERLSGHGSVSNGRPGTTLIRLLSDDTLRIDAERERVASLQIAIAHLGGTGKRPASDFLRLARAAARLVFLRNSAPRKYRRVIDRLDYPQAAFEGADAPLNSLAALDAPVRSALLGLIAAHPETHGEDSADDPDQFEREGGTPAQDESSRIAVPFGGVFLLLPYLALVPIDARPGRNSETAPEENDAVLRMLLLIACLGWSKTWPMLRTSALWRIVGAVPPLDTLEAERRIARFLAPTGSEEAWAGWANDVCAALRPENSSHDAASPLRDDPDSTVKTESAPDPPDLTIPSAMRRAFEVTSLELLTAFAAGLSGFEGSSADYVRRNFLDFRAVMREEPGRIAVTLGKPPLGYVLRRAGWTNQTFACSWLAQERVQLFPE